jgi:hypothetical protein
MLVSYAVNASAAGASSATSGSSGGLGFILSFSNDVDDSVPQRIRRNGGGSEHYRASRDAL